MQLQKLYEIALDLTKMNLPPFVANGSMTLAKYLPKNFPLDFRKKFVNGKRILGEHKTFGGLLIGLCFGSLSGYFAGIDLTYSASSSLLAIAGDAVGSFTKRRFGKKEGEDFPVIDRTFWLLFHPFLYAYISRKPVPEFLTLYLSTLAIGFLMHKYANVYNPIPKLVELIKLKVRKRILK